MKNPWANNLAFSDLNYRLNTTYAEAKALAESPSIDDCSTLLSFDQLKQQIEAGKAFHQFQEGIIEFKPTYKFDVGTNNFDTRFASYYSEKKKQIRSG
jgi:phosphatidylinositol-bisphosphatase